MAKGKKSSSSGPTKSHGPKKKMWHCWDSTTRLHLAQAGLLTKYHNFESWQQACQAKGKRNATETEFNEFVKLSDEDKKAYFENLKK
jgi:hypothetical protein